MGKIPTFGSFSELMKPQCRTVLRMLSRTCGCGVVVVVVIVVVVVVVVLLLVGRRCWGGGGGGGGG